uniref:FMRFamide receptor n=1 Tax=Octopus vulgaris TaxID=6645 RepID=A0A6C0PN81_OCTVU|nr:FMRFamide receptor [Octopus vulgaris]
MIPSENLTNIITTKSYNAYEQFYLEARSITGLVCYPIACSIGLMGNTMSIIVMTQKQMQSSTNIYLLALAFSDSIKLINDFLYFIVILLMEIDKRTGESLYQGLYPYAHYIFNTSLCISAWITVSVAVERYVYVCKPLYVKSYCTIHRARIITVCVYFFMSMLSIPYAMRYQSFEVYDNRTNQTLMDMSVTKLWQNNVFSRAYTWFQNLIRSVIPLLTLIVLNTCIMCGIRRCKLSKSRNMRRYRITIMLVCVVLVFMVCISPDAIMSTILGFGYIEEDYLTRGIREITDLLLLINSAVNFILYCIFNTIFWKNFLHIFCAICIKIYCPHHQMNVSTPSRQLQSNVYREVQLATFPGTHHFKLVSVKRGNGEIYEEMQSS